MQDEDKTKEQFLIELHELRQRLAELEKDKVERKQSEEALRKSEEEYRNIFESAVEGLYRVTPDGARFLTANPAAARILGYESPEEIIGTINDIATQIYANPNDREEALRLMREQGYLKDFMVQCRHKDGSIVWCSFSARIVRDDQGNILYHEGTSQDISERKRAEEALRKAHGELEQRVAERTEDLRLLNEELRADNTNRKLAEDALKKSEEQLRFLSSRLLEAQEEERKRIARELHDSIGQTLAAVKFNIENLLQREGIRNSEMLAKPLETLVPIIQEAIEETRRICTGLRPSILDDLGIFAAISWFCREFKKTFPAIHLEHILVKEAEIREDLKIIIFRIIQEALNNVAKHSKTEAVRLSLKSENGTVELIIKDKGIGFDLDSVLSKDNFQRGLGLTGMRERVELSGGVFDIESIVGKGTALRASWTI